MPIQAYLTDINNIFKAGNATEHSYRPALKTLFEQLTSGLTVTNEPKRIACGAPDYIVTKRGIPVGYIEAKDIDIDLNGNQDKAQFDRYKQSLDNLIITDYLTFQLFENGQLITSVSIASTNRNSIEPNTTQFDIFTALINRFAGYDGKPIKTSLQLSKMMATKARLMANIIENALEENETADNNSLHSQFNGFKEMLIPKITRKEFADIYAQTIAYGMFAAKINDTPHTTSLLFTRGRAAELIPPSNPFLRKLFQHIAGYDLDTRICWIVDDLADLFNHADIKSLLKEFYTKGHDPIVHFYETFLSEFDSALRKSRGVWYTPQPVVQFIVRAVDDLLKREFGILHGLADTSKVRVRNAVRQNESLIEIEEEFHRVQILDPAAGTGTFLAEVVQNLYQCFQNQPGLWQSYVHEHLIPRLNGFEILMASYAMAHLKLDMILQQTGYKTTSDERLRIYLTNSLEEGHAVTEAPFVRWISDEANEASRVKVGIPVMVVLGNPPYSGESQNNGKKIMSLMVDYKKEPNTDLPLQERNPKWINDDYVKFIRFGQHFIENNGEGILAFINNHSFLDNPTFRGMRYSLLKTFDKIYILDLHGNAKKREAALDGSRDENVFDIQQGVSINIFIKTKTGSGNNHLARVFHFDLFGKRSDKYDFLQNNTLQSMTWRELEPIEPQYFFVPKNFSLKEEYDSGFGVQEIFIVNSVGIVTARDKFTIHNTIENVKNTINEFIRLDIETARNRFNLGKDARDWSVTGAKNDITSTPDFRKIVEINYRPFDKRFTYYTGKSKGFHCMPRDNLMQHFLKGENVGLVFRRQQPEVRDLYIFCSDYIIADGYIRSDNKGGESVAPLYLYITGDVAGVTMPTQKTPNVNKDIISKISQQLNLQFIEEKQEIESTFAPIDVFDYIYAVLHSPTYRERYKEFLKIDFPRIPYPESADEFWRLVSLGSELRLLHLMEHPALLGMNTDYPLSGTGHNNIDRILFAADNVGQVIQVWINETQYFDNIPLSVWNFYIGGYQPAQKWLKDRKGRILTFDDIVHYQKIIVVLKETIVLMNKVDMVLNNLE